MNQSDAPSVGSRYCDVALGEEVVLNSVSYPLHAHVYMDTWIDSRQDKGTLNGPSVGEQTSIEMLAYVLHPATVDVPFAIYPTSKIDDPPDILDDEDEDDSPMWLTTYLRHATLGRIQAWHDPTERAVHMYDSSLAFWCCQGERMAQADMLVGVWNRLLAAWKGSERFLTDHFPEAQLLYTEWDDGDGESLFHTFVSLLGYEPVSASAYCKPIR